MAEQEARQRQTIIYVMADWEYQDYLKRNKYTEAEDEDGGRVFHYVPVMHTNLQEYLVPASCYYGQENIMATYFKGLFGSIRIGFAEVTIQCNVV